VVEVSRNFRGNQIVHVKGSEEKTRSEPHLQSPVQTDVGSAALTAASSDCPCRGQARTMAD